MPRGRCIWRFLQTILRGDGPLIPDGELLRRSLQTRDSAAFELLVRRHATAVLAACRGALVSNADAKDAFQSTFLVLVENAGTLRGATVGAWLHRVAMDATLKPSPKESFL